MLYGRVAQTNSMKTLINRKNRKSGFTLIELMVVIAILATLGAIGYAPIMNHMNDGDRQQAKTNLSSIGKMLLQFQLDNNTYPCDATAEMLQEKNPDMDFGELKGNNSNAYFRQLFFKEGNETEKPFFAKVKAGALLVQREGDEQISKGRALQGKENAMSYVMRRSREDELVKEGVEGTNVPLAMCSVYPSNKPYTGDKLLFDRKSFRGHVFVLSTDGSVNDLDENRVTATDEDDTVGVLKPGDNLFPETKKGRATSQNYLILTPEI